MYIVTTTLQKGLVLRGLWALTITDHALGWFIERNPSGDLDQAIMGGHSTLMKSPERCVERMIRVPELMISDGGDGAWMVGGGYYKSQDDQNRKCLVWRARSWVSKEMLYSDQMRLASELTTCIDGDVPLGQRLLHPHLIRDLHRT
jgi:hypothetical protein